MIFVNRLLRTLQVTQCIKIFLCLANASCLLSILKNILLQIGKKYLIWFQPKPKILLLSKKLCNYSNIKLKYSFYKNLFFILFKQECVYVQGVSEIRVFILTGGRTRKFMKLFSITFCKICNSFPRFFPQFLPNESFCVIN
jgi:hypothetical protein